MIKRSIFLKPPDVGAKGEIMDTVQPSPERIMQVANGCCATSILATSAIHSVFTHLENGATRAEDVAKLAGISARGAQTLLDGPVGLGFVRASSPPCGSR
jgi:hypothetical protein